MKKKSICLLLMLAMAASLVLPGCGKKNETKVTTQFAPIDEPIPEETTVEEQQPEETEAEPEPEEEPVEEVVDNEQPPREGMVRSSMTNEWIDAELAERRPLAVMYPINKQAQPQYGLDRVEVFYEIMEEGDMSRQMAIMEDWSDLGRIGNIRSIRDYFVYAGLEWDPVFIHFGGPELYVKSILTREDVDNINGVGGGMGPDYGAYYRVPAGSTSEHTAYTDGQHVLDAIDRAGFSKNHRSQYWEPNHFQFVNASNPNTLEQYSNAVAATEIDMTKAFPVTQSALTYNESDHKYYKRLYGNAQCDAVTGTQLAFDNVIIQNTYYERRDDHGYLAFQMHDTTRDGYFITRGKMIHVTWRKEGDYKPTRYFDDNGNEIKLNTGKTMIFVVRLGDSFTINGNTY